VSVVCRCDLDANCPGNSATCKPAYRGNAYVCRAQNGCVARARVCVCVRCDLTQFIHSVCDVQEVYAVLVYA
jgi:hypothetical protein